MSELIRLMFDIGHGGTDPGACANGLKEKNINLIVGLAALAYVRENYIVDARVSRETDVSLLENDRVKLIANFNPKLCISIHHNAASDIKARGSEVIHGHYDKEDDILAKDIMNALVVIGMPKRRDFTKLNSAGKDWYYMVRRIWDSDTHAIIFEGGFVTNKEDAKLLSSIEYLKKEGAVIGECAAQYLKLPKRVIEPVQEDWGQPYINNLLTLGLISKMHESREPVEWDEFAKVISNVVELVGVKQG